MAQQMQTRRNRQATPERWQKAAQRAIAEGVRVFQVAGSGQWVANSGSDPNAAYEVAVTGNVAHGCTCLAGLNDDPVCKHRAAFYLMIGSLSIDPEPEPPAPAAPAPICFRCRGNDAGCPVCQGAGVAALAAQVAALLADVDRLAA